MDEIICGDCLDILPGIDSVDLVVTSPPYNMRTRIRNGQYTEREWTAHFSKKYEHFDDALPIDAFYALHKAILLELLRVSPLVVYNIQIVTGSKEAFFALIGDFGKNIKDIIVWDKGFGQPAMHEKVLNSGYELLLILEGDGVCGRVIQNSVFKRGTLQNVWHISRGSRTVKGHSASFPVAWATKAIRNFSKEGNLVLDPFMGTGVTALAAIKTKRRYIGIEISPEYCAIAEEQIQIERSQLKLF